MIIRAEIFSSRFSLSFVLLVQQQQRPPRLHYTPRSYTKLATTPPPLQQRYTTNGTRHQTCTVWSHSPRDGWRRGVAAARFPAKALARTAAAKAQYRPGFPRRGEMSRRNARVDHVATNAHHPHLPASEARKGRGEGWRVRSRLADMVETRPEEGEAHVREDVLRGARVEKALVERGGVWEVC